MSKRLISQHKMPRSAAEATRFTATLPHAYSKPVSSSARLSAPQPPAPNPKYSRTPRKSAATSGNAGSGPPEGETPAEKVARLRAAHLARRQAEISTFDRIVVRGRAIADTAHRVTVTGIIGVSIICVGVVVYSFVDLHRHNNRKKSEWLENEFKMLQVKLVEAGKAEIDGRATDDQILLLNRERAKIQAEEDRKNRTVTSQVKNLLGFSELKDEDQSDDTQWTDSGAGAVQTASSPSTPFAASTGENMANGRAPASGSVTAAVQQQRRQTEQVWEAARPSGGVLDQLADQAVAQAKTDARSWSSWLGFGSK